MLRAWPVAVAAMLLIAASTFAQQRGPARRGAPAIVANDNLDSLAIETVDAAKLKDFVSTMEAQLKPLLATLKPDDFDRIVRLSTFRQFGRHFEKVEKLKIEQAETLHWLVAKPKLLSTLCLAVNPDDEPRAVLAILLALHDQFNDRLEEYPDLTTAFCVVWDNSSNAEPIGALFNNRKGNPNELADLIRYYMNGRQNLRFDPADLPWQLSIYIADNSITPDEIGWAAEHYAGRKAIGNAFFDVPYDTEAFRGTAGMKLLLEKKKYTLQNILQYGGICGDQAYFATHVARSLGVPATICTGKTSEAGEGHAWVGYLDIQAGRAVWNFEEGRYAIYQFWKGDVVDPQTRAHITDGDVSLTAELQNVSPRDRLVSEALCKAADVLDPAAQVAVYMQAIKLSPGNRNAWLELSTLAAQLRLDAKQTADFRAAVAKFALKAYPDFAFEILKRSIAGRGTTQQIGLMNEMRPLFSSRPDIQAEIGLAIGDLYLTNKEPAQALSAYGEVIERNTAIGPVVMEAMQRVDRMLREANHLPELANAYGIVWQRMPQPEASVIVQATPFYRIGERYAKLLEEIGDHPTAQQVHARLSSLTRSVTAIHDRN